jgi:hypothetical protein
MLLDFVHSSRFSKCYVDKLENVQVEVLENSSHFLINDKAHKISKITSRFLSSNIASLED